MRTDQNPNAEQQARKARPPLVACDPRTDYPLVFARLVVGSHKPGELVKGIDFTFSKN